MVLLNPFSIMNARKMIWGNDKPIFLQLSEVSMMRWFTLGVVPNALKWAFLATSQIPSWGGIQVGPAHLLSTVFAIVLSHPFEQARLMMQSGLWKGTSFAYISRQWDRDGLNGLTKGFVPRTLAILPMMLGAHYM
jgi:hypothetical protein